MPHDELKRMLDKIGIGSSLEKVTAITDTARPLADTIRSIENTGVTRAIQKMEERNKALFASFQPHIDGITSRLGA